MFQRFAEIHDKILTEERVSRIEQTIVGAAFIGFFIHLGLIAVHKISPYESILWAAVGDSFLSALYTPFSFILLYEVLGLILALPRSFSESLGAQFQIVALIFIRRIFGDIGRLGGTFEWSLQNPELQDLLADMVGALVIVFLATAFVHAARRIGYEQSEDSAETKQDFIDLKKTLALGLAAIFVALGAWSFGTSLLSLIQHVEDAAPLPDLDVVFYKEMFTVMVFADVVVLLAAYYHTDHFEHVFRNAGFVISTVLLRLAFTAPRPIDVAVAAGAILFAVLVYLLYGYAIHVGARQTVDVVNHPTPEDDA